MSGSSKTDVGVYGTTASGTFSVPGVYGASTKQTGNDSAGTFGIGIIPAYGVVAYGTTYGALGRTTNAGTSLAGGYGIAGMDYSGSANSDFNAALFGYSAHGTGLLAEAGGTPSAGYIGKGFPIGGYFVGDSAGGDPGGGIGVIAESDSVAIDAENRNFSYGPSYVEMATNIDLLDGSYEGSSHGYFAIDAAGNMNLSGKLTENGNPAIRTRGASGATTIAYGDRMITPAIEDVAEAQLSLGRSFVRIDPALADTIDRRGAYHVFLTPEGDCNGLFVTQKSSSGFVVREMRGGHSTPAFEYRIVAKPTDKNGTRLAPAPAMQKPRRLVPTLSRRHMAVPLTPEAQARRSGILH